MPAMSSETEIPATVPAVTIAAFTGLTPQRVAQLAQEGKIPSPGKRGEFPFLGSVRAICDDLRGRNAAKPGAEDIARRLAAEAKTAEINAAKAAGETLLKADVKAIAADYALAIRRTIEHAEFLKPAHRARLIQLFGKIELADPD